MEPSLTNNQKIVLEALEDSEQQLGAYSILFNIEKKRYKISTAGLSRARQTHRNWCSSQN